LYHRSSTKLTVQQGIEEKALFPIISEESSGDKDQALRLAYADVYDHVDSKNNSDLVKPTKLPADAPPLATAKAAFRQKARSGRNNAITNGANGVTPAALDTPAPEAPPPDAFKKLAEAQQAWNESSLTRNKNAVRSGLEADTRAATTWINNKIEMLQRDIKELEKQLGGGAEANMLPLQVLNAEGVTITDEERTAAPSESSNKMHKGIVNP
jgi:hypothetical protein